MAAEDDLIREAEEAERLASLVSYRADKERLLRQAASLRARAAALRRRDGDPPPNGEADDR